MTRRKVAARLAVGLLCGFRGGAAQFSDCSEDRIIFDCEQPPPAALPCAADAQGTWVVDSSAQAQTLAATVSCSGGLFEVEWRGAVVVGEPIYVVNGTVLTVTGAGSEAVIDGNSATRLFTVVNATLHVSGVNITAGAAIFGGAVAAAGSTLVLNRTSFVGNSATGHGGAVYASEGSSVSFAGDETFAENGATSSGGAVYATGGSVVSWTGDVRFLHNSCGGYGGALAVESSIVVATGNAVFAGNVAASIHGYGGAVNAFSWSSVVWSGEVASFEDNFAGGGGGAVSIAWSSEMSWTGPSRFSGNNATGNGGALLVGSSTASWDGHAEFVGNTATHGGAVYVVSDSNVSWTGDTEFFNNTVDKFGGALAVSRATVVSMGNTTFSSNSARSTSSGFGGAVNANVARVTWAGVMTSFQDNWAGNGGGAVAAAFSSEVSCSGPCLFSGNSATSGGAATVSSSAVSWSATTALMGNSAQFGGALFIYNGSRVSWTGDTDFSSNAARSDGGAIAAPLSGVSYSPLDSALAINGTTSFSNNTSGTSGGALALLGGCSVVFGGGAAEVSFVGNTADVAGGAVFLSSTGFGPTLSRVSFVSNSAKVGGAVSTVGSGNTRDAIEVEASSPTTFDGCIFVGNTAAATGGAIESAAGQDAYRGSLFERNKAGTGGALRLAGTASVDDCSFVENASDDGEGAAVSNIGFISSMSNATFSGNVFDCEPGTFLDFDPGSPFEAVCDGCETQCLNCSFDEPLLYPTCTPALDHSNSSGGNTTIETLSVEPGYWRATVVSPNVFGCYNSDACLGGLTGTAAYCREGYEGPYCAICSDGYAPQLGFTCSKCLGAASGIVLAATVLVVIVFVAVAVASYVMSGERPGKRRRIVERLARLIPLQSVKIVIVSWQILTQFTSVADVTYPHVYQVLLDGLDVFNFDLGWILSAGCVVGVDFHDRLLLSTVGPIVALLFLGGTYAAASRLHRGDAEALQVVWNKHVSMVLLLTFFVYASVSSVLFQAFACESLDDGDNYLRADYRIRCDSSKHKAIQVYAGFMTVLYAAGIPFFYGFLLFRDRDLLMHPRENRVDTPRVISTSDLWSPYRPGVFYYEVIECGRRIMLAGVVVFIFPNTAGQIAITLMMAFVFAMLSEGLAPYASRWDTWINRMGHAVVFVSMYVALLLKVDVSDDRAGSQEVFEAFLVTAHACMVLAVVVETAVITWALKVEQLEEPLEPRFRRGKSLSFRKKEREIAPAHGEDGLEDFYGEEAAPF
eukprot:g2167.t1